MYNGFFFESPRTCYQCRYSYPNVEITVKRTGKVVKEKRSEVVKCSKRNALVYYLFGDVCCFFKER